MSDFIACCIVIGGVIVLIFTPVIGGAMYLDYASCRSQGRAIGKPVSWGPLQECIVEIRPGLRVPMDNYRGVEH